MGKMALNPFCIPYWWVGDTMLANSLSHDVRKQYKRLSPALACGASVGRDEHAPSHRPDALRESDVNWTLQKPCF